MKERIQKLLANAGVASRRKVEEMVRQGRVSVNGAVVTELPILIDPDHDRVAVDDEGVHLSHSPGKGGSGSRRAGKPARGEIRRLYILLNKPKDVYSTNVAQGEQTRAIDLLPPDLPVRVYPVGRLDAQSKGLLLLTNDGDLTERLTHPRYGVSKTYRAIVDGFVTPESLTAMSEGVWLTDPNKGTGVKTGRCQIKIVKRARDRSVLDITLNEGRNSQLRRMFAKQGHKVRELTRTRLGPLTLDGVSPGESRLLTPSEIRHLQEWTRRGPQRESRGEKPKRAKDAPPTPPAPSSELPTT